MSCSDRVEDFIRRYSISAVVHRFSDKVATVISASRLCGARSSDILKSLVLIADLQPVVVILPGDRRLNYRKLMKVVSAKSVRMARPDEVKEYLGFDVGGVSPLSECLKRYRVVVDQSVVEKSYALCGGGDEYSLAYVKIEDLLKALNPVIADVSEPEASSQP